MELIIKPTELCNFKCSFCSSSELTEEKTKILDIERIFEFLKRYPNTSTIIVNGGDPLMVSPNYYWNIIHFLDSMNMNTTLAFTTNLWDFYKRPKKWIPLFKNQRVGITTSFNYGETRKISNQRVFTEEDFWNVSNLFLDNIGYRPDFISVINDDNEKNAIDNVLLAKKMGVECKLNYAMASGREGRPFQLSKIYKVYIDIANKNLVEWEFNTKQMLKRLSGHSTVCPQNRNCDESIRCLQPDGDYYSCGAFGDDKEYPINYHEEVLHGKKYLPLREDVNIAMLKEECLVCPMFNICNGCKKTIKDMKKALIVEEHCQLMKTLSLKIQELNVG